MGHLLNQSPGYISSKTNTNHGSRMNFVIWHDIEKISSFWKEKVNLAKILLGKTP
jgi:hypothetical protein